MNKVKKILNFLVESVEASDYAHEQLNKLKSGRALQRMVTYKGEPGMELIKANKHNDKYSRFFVRSIRTNQTTQLLNFGLTDEDILRMFQVKEIPPVVKHNNPKY